MVSCKFRPWRPLLSWQPTVYNQRQNWLQAHKSVKRWNATARLYSVAMGQIPRSTERISSSRCFSWPHYKTATKNLQIRYSVTRPLAPTAVRWQITSKCVHVAYVFRWTPCGWRRWRCHQRDSTSALWLQPLRRRLSHCAYRSVSSTCAPDDERSMHYTRTSTKAVKNFRNTKLYYSSPRVLKDNLNLNRSYLHCVQHDVTSNKV